MLYLCPRCGDLCDPPPADTLTFLCAACLNRPTYLGFRPDPAVIAQLNAISHPPTRDRVLYRYRSGFSFPFTVDEAVAFHASSRVGCEEVVVAPAGSDDGVQPALEAGSPAPN
jgi:hypothetical protein